MIQYYYETTVNNGITHFKKLCYGTVFFLIIFHFLEHYYEGPVPTNIFVKLLKCNCQKPSFLLYMTSVAVTNV